MPMCWYPPNGVRTVAEQARKPGGDHGRPLEVACRAGWPRGHRSRLWKFWVSTSKISALPDKPKPPYLALGP